MQLRSNFSEIKLIDGEEWVKLSEVQTKVTATLGNMEQLLSDIRTRSQEVSQGVLDIRSSVAKSNNLICEVQ